MSPPFCSTKKCALLSLEEVPIKKMTNPCRMRFECKLKFYCHPPPSLIKSTKVLRTLKNKIWILNTHYPTLLNVYNVVLATLIFSHR